MEPALDAEITGHLCYTETDGLLIHAKTLQPKCQLMPHLICDDLVIRILHNVPNSGRLGPKIRIFQRFSFKKYLALCFSVRRKYAFQMS